MFVYILKHFTYPPVKNNFKKLKQKSRTLFTVMEQCQNILDETNKSKSIQTEFRSVQLV